jgi:hypothetical protein
MGHPIHGYGIPVKNEKARARGWAHALNFSLDSTHSQTRLGLVS